MATVKIQGSASGTGSVTLIAPNTNSNRVLTLPDADGTVGGATKAWVNFNGTGTIAIRNNSGVSSITDRGTGRYAVTKANAMSTANYLTLSSKSDTYAGNIVPYNHSSSGPVSTTVLWIEVGSNLSGNVTYGDSAYVGAGFLE